MTNAANSPEKIDNAMRLAKRLVAELRPAADAAFLATLKGLVSHLTTDSFLKTISDGLAANRKVNFAVWHAAAKAAKKYDPPANRHDEAALLFTLFQKIDRREISVADFMMEVDGLMRMDKCYAEFTVKYVERFIGYLEWVIAEKQIGAVAVGAAAENSTPRGPALFAIEPQKSVFDQLMASLQDAVEAGLPAEEKPGAIEELTLIRHGFTGDATPTQVTAATERLCKRYDYFRTRLQDFCWGAELLHLPEDLPPFVKALKAGLAE